MLAAGATRPLQGTAITKEHVLWAPMPRCQQCLLVASRLAVGQTGALAVSSGRVRRPTQRWSWLDQKRHLGLCTTTETSRTGNTMGYTSPSRALQVVANLRVVVQLWTGRLAVAVAVAGWLAGTEPQKTWPFFVAAVVASCTGTLGAHHSHWRGPVIVVKKRSCATPFAICSWRRAGPSPPTSNGGRPSR